LSITHHSQERPSTGPQTLCSSTVHAAKSKAAAPVRKKATRGNDPVRLPLHERLRLRDDDGSTGELPCLLLLLSLLLDVTGGGMGRRILGWLGVNTKNWYRKGIDLWAEFGKETPFGRKFSSKDSVKLLAVGSAPSFGRRAVCA
jgi:hypothetical protein